MPAANHNRVQLIFNAEHKPYLYSAIHIVDGDEQDQRWERPFIVSKTTASGEEVVYGTIKRTLQRISAQLDRLKKFQTGGRVAPGEQSPGATRPPVEVSRCRRQRQCAANVAPTVRSQFEVTITGMHCFTHEIQ